MKVTLESCNVKELSTDKVMGKPHHQLKVVDCVLKK